MNNLMLLVVLFVMFIYFGGSNVPLVLKQNKEMLLGVAGGLVLCSFFGMKLEGFDLQLSNPDHAMKYQVACCEMRENENGQRLPGVIRDFDNCRTLAANPEMPGVGAALCQNLGANAYSTKTCSDGAHRVTKDRSLINKDPLSSCTSDFECCGELACENGKCGGDVDETCDCDKLSDCGILHEQLVQFPVMSGAFKTMCDTCIDKSPGSEDTQLKTRDSMGCQ